jgi:hypothetical protein
MPFGIYTNFFSGIKFRYDCTLWKKIQCAGDVKEFFMKKIVGKIAMILVMVASMVTSCFTQWAFEQHPLVTVLLFLPCFALDLIVWPIVFIFAGVAGGGLKLNSVYTADGETPLTEDECAFLTEKAASLPEADTEFVTALIAALPETERVAALERLNAVPEQWFPYTIKVMRALYAMPQADRVSLVGAIRSLPEKEQLFLTETTNSLTSEEIAALADEVSAIPVTEMARQIQILRKTSPLDWGYREYAAERFVGR